MPVSYGRPTQALTRRCPARSGSIGAADGWRKTSALFSFASAKASAASAESGYLPAMLVGKQKPVKPSSRARSRLGQRFGAAEGVDRGERGKPIRVLLEEPREEVMLTPDLVHRLAVVLEGVREDGALDPRALLLLEVALDVEEVAHEERRVRILAGEMRVEIDAHGARRVSHMGAPAAIA